MFIGGAWEQGRATFAVTSPIDGSHVGDAPDGGAEAEGRWRLTLAPSGQAAGRGQVEDVEEEEEAWIDPPQRREIEHQPMEIR